MPGTSRCDCTLQVRYRGGVRATLASLLQVPQDSIEVALAPRSAAQQPALVARSAAGAPAPVITDSFFISALIAPPVSPSKPFFACCTRPKNQVPMHTASAGDQRHHRPETPPMQAVAACQLFYSS